MVVMKHPRITVRVIKPDGRGQAIHFRCTPQDWIKTGQSDVPPWMS
jgi:hypothetical protein